MAKTLKQFLEKIKENILFSKGDENFIPQKITSSSENCIENSVFVAITGEKHDGHNFILEAIKKGAKAIFLEKDVDKDVIQKIPVFYAKVSNSRLVYSLLLEEFYDNPYQKLKLIAVTGTNGKTTTTYILHNLISTKYNCGMISTVEYTMPYFREAASRTTPSPEKFQQLLSMMVKKCSFAVMELSSHGLHQQRTGSAKFAAAVFTNLSGDHLDYHKTMENYYQAKKILFENLLENNGYAVINSDNHYGKRLISELNNKNLISCGLKGNPDFKITNIKYSEDGMQFYLTGKESFKINSNLFGKHNVMNISQAFIVAMKLGLNPKDILISLRKGIEVPGRLQKFQLKNGAVAFVDYAHTDDA
ncbi:MAG TPA: UDP-N-acetylmuramyl-tripeptide synthetase, partial [Victivallales bacterium]|nr:UDP-N-acetylmuramyl-tripeptide synthetase [Victivallales bacterium]